MAHMAVVVSMCNVTSFYFPHISQQNVQIYSITHAQTVNNRSSFFLSLKACGGD